MKRVFFLFAFFLLSGLAQARPLFSPAPLASFDGTRWSGLVLGRTTFKDVRGHVETGRGAYERSTELSLPKNAGVRVDCLWSKRGNDEVLSAIALRYSGATPSSQQLKRAFGANAETEQTLYQRGRFDDWRVLQFSGRGVTAFQVHFGDSDANSYATPLLVLSKPASLRRVLDVLSPQETSVEEFVDPFADQPKVGEIGEVRVEFNGRETDAVPSWMRSDVQDDLHEAAAGGTMRWNPASSGFYKMSVSASRAKDENSGSFSVSTEIQAPSPYTWVRVYGSGSQKWKRDDDDLPTRPSEAFIRAMRVARRDAESKFQRAVLASGPPTLATLREAKWLELVTRLRDEPSTPTGVPLLGF